MDYTYMMHKARKSIKCEVKINQKFSLKDLFEGCEWETLSKGERINFGKFFRNEVRENHIPEIQYLEKANNNHARYIKIV